MQSKLDEIRSTLKEARNAGYLCKYDQSMKYYKKIIDAIEQQIILNNISRKSLEDWRSFQAQAIQQKKATQSLKNMLSGMNYSNNSAIYNRNEQPLPPFSNKSIHVQDSPFRVTNSNFRATNRGFSANRGKPSGNMGNQPYNKPFKDPDVWESPPPLQKRQSVQRVNKANSVRTNNIRNGPAKKKNQSGKNGQKKTFLDDRYPNGSGPDSNLIEMLEREVLDKSPNIQFDDIADLQNAKGLLQEAVLLPLKMPQFFKGIRRAWKGVLMFGPPGTGKTLLAKAVASSGGTTFFNVSASSLASKWKGQSQKLVRILFQMAKFYAPSVVFFDEIDALGGKRKQGQDESNRKVKTELLVQMDGATSSANEENKFVIVLAATNRPWDLDEALRRRLQKRIYIPLPNEKGRRQLFKINLKELKVQEGVQIDQIVKKTEGYSGADISNLCREAAMLPMRRKLKNQGGYKNIMDMKKFQEEVNTPLSKSDFVEAIKNVNKSVGSQDLHKYQKWMKQFGTV